VQMALHHELVSVEPRSLREAVEERWLAFRRPAATPARTSVPSAGPSGMAPQSNPGVPKTTAARAARLQTSARWARTQKPCRGGRPQRSSSC
jgi:hypothetical protein